MSNLQNGSLAIVDSTLMASNPSTSSWLAVLVSLYDTNEKWNTFIGIVTAIVGNVLISFALNTQRYAHLRLEREEKQENSTRNGQNYHGVGNGFKANGQDEADGSKKRGSSEVTGYENDGMDHEDTPLLGSRMSVDSNDSEVTQRANQEENNSGAKKSYLRSPYWWIGIILMAIGESGNFLAYGFAPASIVSPLGVVALVSNCLIAPIMLKEQFRKRDILGVIISIGGAVTVVLSAKGSNPKLGPNQIWQLVKRWEFLTYSGINVFFILMLMTLSNTHGHTTVIIDIGLVGLFGGYTALSTKGVASLISNELWLVFTFPIFYVLIVILVVTAVMQIKYVNRALQHFDSTQVIPTQFVMFTIFVVAGSAILYRDFERETADKVGQFFGGVVLTFLGVWCITGGRNKGQDNEVEIDEEDRIDLVDNEVEQTGANDPIRHNSPPATPKASRQSSHRYQNSLTQATPSEYDTPASFVSAVSQRPSSQSVPNLLATPMPRSQASEPNMFLSASSRNTGSFDTPYRMQHEQLSASTPRTYDTPSMQTPHNTLRPGYRHSMIGSMYPSPFTSPLSAGLSVVVADLRRERTNEPSPRNRANSGRRTSVLGAPSDSGSLPRRQGPRDSTAAASSTSSWGMRASSDGTDDRPPLDRAAHSVEVAITDPESSSTASHSEGPSVYVALNKDAVDGNGRS